MAVFRSGKVSVSGDIPGRADEAGRPGEIKIGGGPAESGGGQTTGRAGCSPGEGRKRENGKHSIYHAHSMLYGNGFRKSPCLTLLCRGLVSFQRFFCCEWSQNFGCLVSINQASFRLLEKNIPSDTDAEWI